jgi:hypothetical protein
MKCVVCGGYEAKVASLCDFCLKSFDKATRHDNGLETIVRWAVKRYQWAHPSRKVRIRASFENTEDKRETP